jgi:SAM-dependent methyltransferase
VPLFDRIAWRDPISGVPLEPIIAGRTPGGVPISGALRVAGSNIGYPIVDSVARLTPELAHKYRLWLKAHNLVPPTTAATAFQQETTVESFGFQWSWIGVMRSEADLEMRVASRFGLSPDYFRSKLVLDAGAGAGDQSRYLVDRGAAVVSVDLSSAIDVVASKLRMSPDWVGVQGDITMLPFAEEQFDIAYCEGVIQHTRDSTFAVRQLIRVVRPAGLILATHYTRSQATTLLRRAKRKLTLGYYEGLRRRLMAMDHFKRLLITGNLAALSYVPFLGRLIRATGTAVYYDLMPEFRTTWVNTFDYYGSHAFQRFITTEEFISIFEATGNVELQRSANAIVRAQKRARPVDTLNA